MSNDAQVTNTREAAELASLIREEIHSLEVVPDETPRVRGGKITASRRLVWDRLLEKLDGEQPGHEYLPYGYLLRKRGYLRTETGRAEELLRLYS